MLPALSEKKKPFGRKYILFGFRDDPYADFSFVYASDRPVQKEKAVQTRSEKSCESQ